jgi:imidazolonepropionase-like amidohydrolase
LFSEAGGKILVATDSGEDKLIGIGLHREMKMLAAAGITPYRILLGATRWPAEMTYKDELIGTIEKGRQADLVILGSDPTADINNSRDIRYVIKGGTVLRSSAD